MLHTHAVSEILLERGIATRSPWTLIVLYTMPKQLFTLQLYIAVVLGHFAL
jgi:hypothetical protein